MLRTWQKKRKKPKDTYSFFMLSSMKGPRFKSGGPFFFCYEANRASPPRCRATHSGGYTRTGKNWGKGWYKNSQSRGEPDFDKVKSNAMESLRLCGVGDVPTPQISHISTSLYGGVYQKVTKKGKASSPNQSVWFQEVMPPAQLGPGSDESSPPQYKRQHR